jgi:hypothetical protein
MARIRKSTGRRPVSSSTRERLRVFAREQIATSMRIEGRSFPSVEAERQRAESTDTGTSE